MAKKDERINVLEARAVLTLLRMLSRTKGIRHKRVLVVVDSTVVLHAVTKGRSSSFVFNSVLRAMAAIQLATDFQLVLLGAASKLNPADEPSRTHE